jgi:hypothetical protein
MTPAEHKKTTSYTKYYTTTTTAPPSHKNPLRPPPNPTNLHQTKNGTDLQYLLWKRNQIHHEVIQKHFS